MSYAPQEMAELAAKYVNTTDQHIFLTGKAGTGKTTFLRYIVQHTYKNAIIAAPTGIAAINAGGVTLHSLLQLPFGTFVPENIRLGASNSPINTPNTLFREFRFNAQKRKLIQELELLIIDEVSMLRADLLDCIDHTLRHLRRKRQPFGGVQLLLIGDLMQLPPVIKEQEMELLSTYYASPYFFEALALRDNPPILVELQKIYRQSDQDFIDLLNRLRHNEQTEADVERLNAHYEPNLDSIDTDGYIHLTTHNRKADDINATRLSNLPGKAYRYEPKIEGEFPENLYPTGDQLVLKEGAQVMFIKNDPTGQGKFFNGKIGHVSSLSNDQIKVRFAEGNEIVVGTYMWENKRYVLNKTTNEIEEKFLGSFEQYPLKLAWAVTIHKSQGLTFERAILDLQGTFAPGQLYVALSRLTSLNGLIMSSCLPSNPPTIDESLESFSRSFHDESELKEQLSTHRKAFLLRFAYEAFDFTQLISTLRDHERSFNKDENRSLKQQFATWTQQLITDTQPLKEVGNKFITQIEQALAPAEYLPYLAERLAKAEAYFTAQLTELKERILTHRKTLSTANKVRTYLKELDELVAAYSYQQRQILKLSLLVQRANENKVLTKQDLRATPLYGQMTKQVKERGKDKTPTAEISFAMYKEGKTLQEIAEARGLVEGTIAGHMASYVERGELKVLDFLPQQKLDKILNKIKEGLTNSGEIKATLGDEVSYVEIKLALAHAKSQDLIAT